MKTFKKAFYLPLLFLTLFTTNIFAAATFTQGSTAQALANQISGVGITITNPQITFGENSQRGIFSNGIAGAGLEIDEGIILTTMSVTESFTTNDAVNKSVNNDDNDDTDLRAIDTNARYNTIVFEFDVTLDDNTRLLLIDYQFASEEYPEYVGSKYNDAFGFFISGGNLNVTYNIARVIDNQTFVTINDINNHPTVTVNNVNVGAVGANDDAATPEDLTNAAFFIDNNQNNVGGVSPVTIEYDGITKSLHATLDNLTPGETYHFKMAIADTSDSNLNTAVFVNKINGLTEPSICYDYAYKQNGLFLTEGYDATKGPYISGDVVANDATRPLDVAMYFRNTKDSDIVASNITLDIIDINTTQATYTPESVYVTETNSLFKIKVNDADLNVSNSYVKEIPVTSFDAYEYFYTYFSVDPLVDTLELPIIARINYDLTIPLSLTESTTITRSSLIDTDVPICGGGSNNFEPVYGLFNIIENGLFTDSTNYFYNLNTQVTNRDANLSIVTIDANATSNPNLHILTSGITTVVGIDMLDLKSFHYTGASCSEAGNAITDRSWIIINAANTTTPLIFDDIDFYQTARENVTFRISYNMADDNGSLVKLTLIESGPHAGNYVVENFTELAQGLEDYNSDLPPQDQNKCVQPVVSGNQTYTTMPQACGNASASNGISPEMVKICNECVYGANTNLVCARDNFAIRPEAFLMHLNDQNQSNPADEQSITTNFSGVISPTNTRLELAADYAYHLEVNATNHLNNTASPGYNFHLNAVSGTSSGLTWSPKAGQVVSGCNDTTDKLFTTMFINGVVDMNTSLTQVGDYTLSLLDTAWTTIDSVQQSHHTGFYFQSGSDCVLNSSNVASTNEYDHLNGCNISSNHTSSSDSNLIYNDYNVTYHPYQFQIAATTTIGMGNITPPLAKPFVYMADIDQDDNMSVHLNATITAIGKNSTNILSNFVRECFAKPVDINITKSDTNNTQLQHKYILHDLNSTGSVILANDLPGSIPKGVNQDANVTTTSSFFQKNMNGAINTRTNLNFHRDTNATANPENITFITYTVQDPSSNFNADLNPTKTADGSASINQAIIHYYGRTNAPKKTVVCKDAPCRTNANLAPLNTLNNPDNTRAFVYFEVFCNGTINGNTCVPALLPNATFNTDDIRWWTNNSHDQNGVPAGTDGIIGIISEVSATTKVSDLGQTLQLTYQYETILQYNSTVSPAFPYTGNMQNAASRWLIYDEANINATTNKFRVDFMRQAGWSGRHETNTTTQTRGAVKVNRRSMW